MPNFPKAIEEFLAPKSGPDRLRERYLELPQNTVDPRLLENLAFQEKNQGLQDALASIAPFAASPTLSKGLPLPLKILDFLTAGEGAREHDTREAVVPTPTKVARKMNKLIGKINANQLTPSTLLHERINSRDKLYHQTWAESAKGISKLGEIRPGTPGEGPSAVSLSRTPQIGSMDRPVKFILNKDSVGRTVPIAESGFQKTVGPYHHNRYFEYEVRPKRKRGQQGASPVKLDPLTSEMYIDLKSISDSTASEIVAALQPRFQGMPIKFGIGSDPRTAKPVDLKRSTKILLGKPENDTWRILDYLPKRADALKWKNSTVTPIKKTETIDDEEFWSTSQW